MGTRFAKERPTLRRSVQRTVGANAVGRDTISHPDRGHDDVANAVAGAAALSKFAGYDASMRWVSGDDDDVWTAKTPGWVPLIGI